MEEATYVEGFHDKNKVQKMIYNPFGNTGLRVSKLTLGGGSFGGFYEPLEEEEAIEIIKESVQSGINYIDTSPMYGGGKSEEIIGKALMYIPREAYYIGTKVGRYSWKDFDFSAEKARSTVDNSLKLLGIDYVDVIQIHNLEYAGNLDIIINETLPALQKIVEEGKARFIGITAYDLKSMKEVIERSKVKIDLLLSYCRCTLIDDELEKYLPFFKKNGVGVINASLVGSGLLTPRGVGSWHSATDEIKEASRNAVQYCQKSNLDISKLAMQHCLRIEGISTHLSGIGTMKVLRENLKIVSEEPTQTDLEHIQELQKRFFSTLSCKNWEVNIFKQVEDLQMGKK